MLIVAGTADLRVPAAEEATRIAAEVGPDTAIVHMVESAGHAGATDDRVNIAALMEAWRHNNFN